MGMRSGTASVTHRKKSLCNASYDRALAVGSGQKVCGLETSPQERSVSSRHARVEDGGTVASSLPWSRKIGHGNRS